MHLGAIYLVVNDFEKSIKFYEKILQIPVTQRNMDRFAMFCFEGNCIAIMNGHFDTENPDKVEHRGKYEAYFDDMKAMAVAPNTHKFVLNFWTENLKKEHSLESKHSGCRTMQKGKSLAGICGSHFTLRITINFIKQ